MILVHLSVMECFIVSQHSVALRKTWHRRLKEFQEIYLAEVFAKLTKAGLIRSSIGAKGGYELARPADQISFWGVVVAVEGRASLFECRSIRSHCALFRNKKSKPDIGLFPAPVKYTGKCWKSRGGYVPRCKKRPWLGCFRKWIKRFPWEIRKNSLRGSW